MQEEKSRIEKRLIRNERNVEETMEKLQTVYRGFNKEVNQMRERMEDMRGPLVDEARNALQENKALLREIGRT